MSDSVIILAGGTGHLGGLVARALRDRGSRVRAIVRQSTAAGKVADLRRIGVDVVTADFTDRDQLARACHGGSCVVSALAGLRDTIVGTQSLLLDAAVTAGVPRFIPSDFAIDCHRMPDGYNRNLDYRREFARILDAAPIAATSILNGMFMELLVGQAPFLLFRFRRSLYWENPDQPMDFTTVADTARFTASAALDAHTPRFLRITGDVASARDLMVIAGRVTGQPFRLFRAGSLKRLERFIRLGKLLAPGKEDVYPPWQGMQYMHNMFDGRAKLEPLDNDRYGRMQWTSIADVLAAAR